jgi:diacylglycerol kinase family enzyme
MLAPQKQSVSPEIPDLEEGKSIAELAAEASKDRYDVVVAGGGDGTVNAVASALAGTPVRMGVIPMGTLNHFAKDLKIPLSAEEAVRTIVAGHVTAVDIGEVNGQIFVNNSSLGLYPAVVRLRETIQKSGYRKWTAFFQAAWKLFFSRFPRLRLEIKSSAAPFTRTTTPLLFIGNNNYETALTQLGTRKVLNNGKLWVAVPLAKNRWQLVLALLALVRGRAEASDVSAFEAESLIVNNKCTALNVAIDGEVLLLQTPLHYRIWPKALKVIVPADKK